MKEIPKWILENLCFHDPRNPEYDEDEDRNDIDDKNFICYCDNCFYRRTELAEEIIYLLEEK